MQPTYENDNLELSCFGGDPGDMNQSVLAINTMRSIKDHYPEEFNKKLENGYERLEEKLKSYKRQVQLTKQENSRLKDQVLSLETVNKKLQKALGRSNVRLEKATPRFKSPFQLPKDNGLSFDY